MRSGFTVATLEELKRELKRVKKGPGTTFKDEPVNHVVLGPF
jgi:hypothetical protein